MANQSSLNWLSQELKTWVEKEYITEDTANKIRGHYAGEKSASKQTLSTGFVVTAIIGSVLIGLGIILLFAYNWAAMSRPVRTVLSILPLVIAQGIFLYAYFKKPESFTWSEGASIFLALMIGSSIALIGQTYHLGGTVRDFMFVWMWLCVPLIYLLNSSSVFALYCLGISYWVIIGFDKSDGAWYWLFVLAMVPHLLWNILWNKYPGRGIFIGWMISISLFLCSGIAIQNKGFSFGLTTLFIALLFLVLYLCGKFIYRSQANLFERPFQTVALGVIFLQSLLYSFFGSDFTYLKIRTLESLNNASAILMLFLILAFLILSVYGYYKKIGLNPVILGFVIIPLVTYVFDSETLTNVGILYTLYTLGLGGYYIIYGMRHASLSFVNTGMILICLLILGKFFREEYSFIFKGIFFIVIGLGFLVTNYLLVKNFKAKHGN